MSKLEEKYPKEIQKILAKYPSGKKRSAVMPLLYIAQREDGHVSERALIEISEMLGISVTEVASIVGFYTLFYDKPGGKYRIQVCTDLPCALRGSQEFLDKLCNYLDIKSGETTQDGLVTVEEVKCLAACDKAPMFQVQDRDGVTYHENQTLESTRELIESWREGDKN